MSRTRVILLASWLVGSSGCCAGTRPVVDAGLPEATICDGGGNTLDDPTNCGTCGNVCMLPNATARCSIGTCQISTCDTNFYDLDRNADNGCEYGCTATAFTEMGTDCGDGVDNDCDGLIDGVDPDCNIGCLTFELCNGRDDDCDEIIDEPQDLRPTTCGFGPCQATSVCVAGTEICAPSTPPSPTDTTCDDFDDNCNGLTDDGYVPYSCGFGVCSRVSVCAAGAESCTAGAPTSPTDTLCNDLDDDCDAMVDEDWVSTTTCGLGVCTRFAVCMRGIQTCSPGLPTGSDANCNNVDEDCNGFGDDHYIPYSCGTGVCQRNSSCSAGTETCTAGTATGADANCNGIDEDCSGSPDNNWVPSTCGLGVCQRTASCVAGTVECTSGTPTAEICNALDDDCNGVADDRDAVSLCGSIANGTPSCTGGTCRVGTCSSTFYDVDGTFSNGCECQGDGYADACTAAANLGTLSDSPASSLTVSGNLVPSGDEDWFSFNAADTADTTCDVFNLVVQFLLNPSNQFRFDLYRGSCGTSVTCSGIGGVGGANVAQWRTNYYTVTDGECPCNNNPEGNVGAGTHRCSDNSATFFVRVYRAAGGATCDLYELQVSNGGP